MSSAEDSDDQFESADEDIDFEPTHNLKDNKEEVNEHKQKGL